MVGLATNYKVGEQVFHLARKTTWSIYDTIASTPIKYVLLRYVWDNNNERIKLFKVIATYKQLRKVR